VVTNIPDPENEIWLKIQGADENAFSTLFRDYYKRLYVFAARLVKDLESAENIVQDVFVKLWINKNEINITRSIKAYLYTAVKNQSLNYLEQNKRLISIDDSLNLPESNIDSPEENIIKNENYKAIQDAIGELPEKCRRIYLMKKYDDLSYKEISEVLGISINTVKTQMKRALKSLSDKLNYLKLLLILTLWDKLI
jgi:RNA polymerase sigma-70 factor (ECF subfamily)